MSSDRKPNIGIVTARDTGRHLGCCGPVMVHSETIDAIATDACLFANCSTISPA